MTVQESRSARRTEQKSSRQQERLLNSARKLLLQTTSAEHAESDIPDGRLTEELQIRMLILMLPEMLL